MFDVDTCSDEVITEIQYLVLTLLLNGICKLLIWINMKPSLQRPCQIIMAWIISREMLMNVKYTEHVVSGNKYRQHAIRRLSKHNL